MGILKHIPLFAVVLIIYNLVAFMGSGEVPALNRTLFDLPLVSGAVVTLTVDNMLVLLGLFIMFVELIKATRSSMASVVDHGLSTLVFIVFLLEFILVRNMGTPGFLILTTLSLLDVIAGFTVTITASRRDIALDR